MVAYLQFFSGKMGMKIVDLRSDTVMKPTEAMRTAMAHAEVDNNTLGNDPTAFKLESEMAKITGKEAALYVPSGTMANLISVLVHCDVRGSEAIMGDNCHIHVYENGGISTIGDVHPKVVKMNEDGTLDIDLIEAAIRDPRGELVFPTTRLICFENSHANTGGRCLPAEYIDKVGELAKKHNLKLHIDGARIFNASVICLSKGLGAPVGSVIVGSKSFIAIINHARTLRKTLGGGMRQNGILCAAALVALQETVPKLVQDHKNAKTLAEGLSKIKGLKLDAAKVETNIIFIVVPEGSSITAEKLCNNLQDLGVLTMLESSTSIRVVLHHQITPSDVEYTLSCFEKLFHEDLAAAIVAENGSH